MGDTPICVMLDGQRFPDQLRRTYDIMVVRRAEIEPPELRAAGAGSIKAKNASTLGASPFSTFVSLDADTVVWGDLRELADFVVRRFRPGCGQPSLLRSVMDVDVVDTLIPPFDARVHVEDFANTGVYFARARGTRSRPRPRPHAHRNGEPGDCPTGSQGIFNLMVFQARRSG